jgi:hypothetical protein
MFRAARAGATRDEAALSIQLESLSKLAFNISEAQQWRAGPRDDHDVRHPVQGRMMAAKKLAHQATHAIPIRSVTHFATGGDADPRWPCVSLPRQHDEMRRHAPAAFTLHQQKLRALPKSMAARQALRDWRHAQGRAQPGCFVGIVTVRRLRPLSRRRLRILRPAAVAMRARNP